MGPPGGLRTVSKEYEVEGLGETAEAALQAAFKVMRAQALKEAGQPVVYMEPEEVTVMRAEIDKRTERFLLLFWPRERRMFTIRFKIKVLMKTVDLSGIDVEEATSSEAGLSDKMAASILHPGRK